AIDGPSGSGKSTIAKVMANRLRLTYLDTGAMFRAIAYSLQNMNVDFTKDQLSADEENQIKEVLESLIFEYAPSDKVLVAINGEDLTHKIREHHISLLTSNVSKFPVIRNYLKNLQRQIAKARPSILEGRDIGTIIF